MNYPHLYIASDQTALGAQKWHFRLLGAQLFCFVAVSILAAFGSVSSEEVFRVFAVGSAVFLTIAVLLTLLPRWLEYEKIWFGCRAIAESAKSAAWRYMMRVPPFDMLDTGRQDEEFIKQLKEIRGARPGAEKHFVAVTRSGPEITDEMRATRSTTLPERKSLYLQGRLVDQKGWYESKCAQNRKISRRWFALLLILQTAAIVFAIGQVSWGKQPINIVSLLLLLASVGIAWSRVKRYEELVEPYALAAQELSGLESLSQHINTDKDFQEFVTQVEEAISREHTMWCARRSVNLRTS